MDFKGFKESTSAEERLKAMKEYCARFPGPQPVAVGNSYKGEWKNRELKSKGFAEFTDEDAVREFLKKAKGEVEVGGAKVTVKEGKTKFQEKRDWTRLRRRPNSMIQFGELTWEWSS